MKIIEVTNVDFSLRHFLLPLMRELRARGHDVVGVCADGALLAEARAEGFRIEPLPLARSLSPLAHARAFAGLLRLIHNERPDIVHAHMPISGLLARFAAWLCRVRIVAYTCHGFLFNQPGSRSRRLAALALEWLAGRITDRYFTVSAEAAVAARRLHIHAAPVAVGNGRDPARFRPDAAARARVRRGLGVPEDRLVVIAVSRLVRHKGYPELLQAMQRVPDAELWVAGARLASDHGEDLEAAFARATRPDVLGARLRRLGYRTDIASLLAAADIFVLPSHFEGLPMSVIEAMLTALPVVASDISGPREQVMHGQTGLLVPPGGVGPLAEALSLLCGDTGLRARMGEAGRLRAVTLYDEARVVRTTASLLTGSSFV